MMEMENAQNMSCIQGALTGPCHKLSVLLEISPVAPPVQTNVIARKSGRGKLEAPLALAARFAGGLRATRK
jgi:hypothetical protein